MYLVYRRVSPRLLVVLGLTLCTLPGCGGSGNSSVITTTTSRSLTQTFQGTGATNDVYFLTEPLDQSKPYTVTLEGTPLASNVDYTVDPTFPLNIRINKAVPAKAQVVVQYTSLATTTQQFEIKKSNDTAFTLSRAVNLDKPVSIHLVNEQLDNLVTTLSPQQYTFDAKNLALLRLVQAPTPPASLVVTYVPKMP